MKKSELRTLFFEKRNQFSDDDILSKSESIKFHFFNFFSNLDEKTIHLFLPIRSKKEVNTWLIINQLFKQYPSVKLCTSFVNYETNTLKHFYFDEKTEFTIDKWGIPIPQSTHEVDFCSIDIVITPLLAFDKLGYRVGYGKGYYDTFFSNCSSNVKKIGLSLFEMPIQIDDINSFDIPLDYCITPFKIIKF